VAYLEPFMEKKDGSAKGILVLATVKGDVHDIGKNLVDIILTNNGYKVINLGIKQPVGNIMEAARQHAADAIGMSGLLVKSTVIMKENLEEMKRAGFDVPVLLGGAALTRKFVEEDCRNAYEKGESVHYAKDAFAGLRLMDNITQTKSNKST
jgi:5-methyltetrahydrofolate--homocysteine methyltransferase